MDELLRMGMRMDRLGIGCSVQAEFSHQAVVFY